MSEALTPHLTREQYREGYLANMGKEIANEAYNLQAVEAYLASGQSAADAINESATVTAGIPLATLKAVNAVKFRGTVQNATAAIQPLNLAEQQFIYTASDSINTMLRSLSRDGKKVTPEYFRQIVSDIMKEATGSVPSYKNPLIQGPDDLMSDQMEQLPAQNTLVNPVNAKASNNDKKKSGRNNNQTSFNNPNGNAADDDAADKGFAFGPLAGDDVSDNFARGAIRLGNLFGGRGLIGRNSVPQNLEMKYQRSIRGSGLAKPLASFGKYQIDLKDFKDGHLSLYTASGNKQRKIPRQAIGGNVSNVLKSIVVGKRPKPKDVLSLNDEEKEYLAGIGVASGLEDLSDMPTKKKTEEQKEMHEFEVLKGQIGAGNDNPKIVKDFKNMLIKMVKAKKIRKNEAHDILIELAALGH